MDEQVRVAEEPEPDGRDRCREELVELGRDPLAGQVADQRRAGLDPGQRRRVHAESERRGEADGPDHPQGILLESDPRVTYSAQDTRCRVGATVVRVHDDGDLAVRRPARIGAPGHRVDREVAPRQVGLDRVAELDTVRASEVGVVVVLPEGRDLDVTVVGGPDRDRAEAVLVHRAGEEGLDPVRARVRREIPIQRLPAKEHIADGPAHDICGMAVRPQRPEHVQHGPRDGIGDPWLGHGRGRGQFRPRNRYERQASLRSSARYGVNSE